MDLSEAEGLEGFATYAKEKKEHEATLNKLANSPDPRGNSDSRKGFSLPESRPALIYKPREKNLEKLQDKVQELKEE